MRKRIRHLKQITYERAAYRSRFKRLMATIRDSGVKLSAALREAYARIRSTT